MLEVESAVDEAAAPEPVIRSTVALGSAAPVVGDDAGITGLACPLIVTGEVERLFDSDGGYLDQLSVVIDGPIAQASIREMNR